MKYLYLKTCEIEKIFYIFMSSSWWLRHNRYTCPEKHGIELIGCHFRIHTQVLDEKRMS